MKKVLITGKNSYVGNSIKDYLLSINNGYQVDVLDMLDPNWRNKSFKEYDVVYHVAGIAHSDTKKINKNDLEVYKKVNVDLTIEVAKKAKEDNVKQFIFMSSIIVYGDSGKINQIKRITKDSKPNPSNNYGQSKILAEQGLETLRSNKFKVAILRCPMIYGRNCKGNFLSLKKLSNKLSLLPYVKNERSMLYIENLAIFVKFLIDNEEDGLFFPQNKEYVDTCNLIKLIRLSNNKKTHFIKGISWMLKLLSKFTGLVNKAFGNLSYDMSMSQYKQDYQLVSLEESIKKIK